jgi:hypothetical protein
MAKHATQANDDANADYTGWENTSLGNYNNAMSGYMSNVNSTLAGGDPYKSTPYLTNQNILTSGAMNSAGNKANQENRDVALRTGTNTAAVQASRDANAQQASRDLTTYNASRDTENEDKWLQMQDRLRQEQLAGANSEANVYGTSVQGRGNSLNNLTSIQNSEDALWGSAISGVAGAAGAGLAGAAGKGARV